MTKKQNKKQSKRGTKEFEGCEVKMMITEEMIAEDEKRWNDRNIVAELEYCGKNICHRKSITNDDIRFYAYIMRKAHALLKEYQEKQEGLLPAWQDRTQEHICQKCGGIVWQEDNYCSKCGQAVKWN